MDWIIKVISIVVKIGVFFTAVKLCHKGCVNIIPRRLFYKSRSFKYGEETFYVVMLWNPSFKDIKLSDFSEIFKISFSTYGDDKPHYEVVKRNHRFLDDFLKVDGKSLVLKGNFPKRSGVVFTIKAKNYVRFNFGKIDKRVSCNFPELSFPYTPIIMCIWGLFVVKSFSLFGKQGDLGAFLILFVFIFCFVYIVHQAVKEWIIGMDEDLERAFKGE